VQSFHHGHPGAAAPGTAETVVATRGLEGPQDGPTTGRTDKDTRQSPKVVAGVSRTDEEREVLGPVVTTLAVLVVYVAAGGNPAGEKGAGHQPMQSVTPAAHLHDDVALHIKRPVTPSPAGRSSRRDRDGRS